MSHLRVCLLAFFVFGVIVAGFATNCDKEVMPGSECTRLSPLESKLKSAKEIIDNAKNIKNSLDKLLGKKSQKKDASSSLSEILSKFKEINLIPPGMKWCGDGDIAEDYNDLGFFKNTDICCRAHDKCKNNIAAGNTLLNLKNDGIFTRSACSCDDAFYDCLQNDSNSISKFVSQKIGWTYFELLKQQCFRCSCPKAKCNENNTESKDCCDRYEWRDNRNFNSE